MSSVPHEEPTPAVQNEGAKSDKKNIFPTFVDLAAIFGVLVIAQIVGFLIAKLLLPYITTSLEQSVEQGWILLFAQVISMGATIIFIAFLKRSRGAERSPMRFSLKGFNPTVLLGGICMLLSTSVVIEPLTALLPPSPAIDARGLPTLIALIIGAPIFEEIICRGMIFEAMRAKRGVIIAWLGSSLFFGLMHLHPTGIVYGFFMGLILCYIYIRSRSLIAPMILHAFNNAIAYLCIILGLGEASGSVMLRDMINNNTVYYTLYGIAVIILILSTVICVRQFKLIIAATEAQKEAEEQSEDQEEA